MSDGDLGAKVESLGTTGAADGIEFGADGYLYLTGIEDNTVKIFTSLGQSEVVVRDRLLRWPDGIARGPDGYIYVTTSLIHLGADRQEPCRLFRFKVVKH